MIEFYVRWITVKKTMTLDDVPPKWHNEVKEELVKIGFLTE
jgi:hypothetical protein